MYFVKFPFAVIMYFITVFGVIGAVYLICTSDSDAHHLSDIMLAHRRETHFE